MPARTTDKTLSVGPAIESLANRDLSSPWPADILAHPSVADAARERASLRLALDRLFDSLPETRRVTDAADSGEVPEGIVIAAWRQLASFLAADVLQRRLILYLPFELVPSREWRPRSQALRDAAEAFLEEYEKAWRGALRESDARANFFDGNIFESELQSDGPERAVKAAHLLPWLVDRHIVAIDKVLDYARNASDATLRESVIDTLPALVARGHLTSQEAALFPQSQARAPSPEAEPADMAWIASLPGLFKEEAARLNMREALGHSRRMPPKRIAWERQEGERAFIDACAERIARGLSSGSVSYDTLFPLMTAKAPLSLSVVRGIRLGVEALASTDRKRARATAGRFAAEAARLTLHDSLADEVESALARFDHLAVGHGLLESLGFKRRRLDQGWDPKRIASLRPALVSGIEMIASDPSLARILYPVALFFGSRLKDYAKRDADLDAAVFVRPGTSFQERAALMLRLKELFPIKEIDGKIVEFWLEEYEGGLRIREFANADVSLGTSAWAHLLLNSLWIGRSYSVRELYAKLLPGFLRSRGKVVEDFDARWLWLGEMERDVLLYRLLHKGYRRFFTEKGGVEREAAGLDPQSVFWDSGYRRLATKLYVSRVFLPQL